MEADLCKQQIIWSSRSSLGYMETQTERHPVFDAKVNKARVAPKFLRVKNQG